MRGALSWAVILTTAFTIALPAYAQGQDAIREARRHMEAGQEFFLQEQWESAAEEFLEAYELREHTAFLFNAALALHRAGIAERAIELYRRYLTDAPEAPDRGHVEESIRLLEQAAAQAVTPPDEPCTGDQCPEPACDPNDETCEDTPPEPPVVIVRDRQVDIAAQSQAMKSIIQIDVEPADANIILMNDQNEEVARGSSPLEYTTDAGRYTLVLEHPEYRTIRTPVQIAVGRYYVFHIEMSQPPAFLQVISNIPGSTVYMDDREVGPVGTTPWGDVVRTGTHRIWIERPGYQTVEQEVTIELGQEQEVNVELERLPFGMLRVLTNVERAELEMTEEVVGQIVGRGEPYDHQLDPGEHQIRVTADGMKDYETTVTINRGQTTRVLVRFNPRPSRTSAWVSLSFSAAVFIAAGVVGWYSTTIYDDIEQDALNGRLSTDDERIDKGFIFAIAADVGFGIGAVIAGLSLYYFLRDPLPPSEGRVEEPVDFTENPPPPGTEQPAVQQETTSDSSARFRNRRNRRGRLASMPRVQFGPGFTLHF